MRFDFSTLSLSNFQLFFEFGLPAERNRGEEAHNVIDAVRCVERLLLAAAFHRERYYDDDDGSMFLLSRRS